MDLGEPKQTCDKAFGKEKRIPISKKVNFIRGWEIITGASLTNFDRAWGTVNFGAGLVLGVQLDLLKQLAVNMEVVSSIIVAFCHKDDFHFRRVNLLLASIQAFL